jgi:pyruvate kinase
MWMHEREGDPLMEHGSELLVTVSKRQATPQHIVRLAETGATGIRLIAKGYRPAEYRQDYDALLAAGNAIHPGFRVIVDLPGGKPRISSTADDVDVERGMRLLLQQEPGQPAAGSDIPVIEIVGMGPFITDLHSGHRILVSDGSIDLHVVSIDADGILVEVMTDSGRIAASRSINLPDSHVRYSSRGDDDGTLIAFSANDAPEVAVSMTGSARDVSRVRELVPKAKVIAKIESQAGLERLAEIAEVADGLMVARADLSIEVKLPLLGRTTDLIAAAAREAGCELIVASGLLTSIEHAEPPSIGDVSDLYHLHSSGVRRFLLSGNVSITNSIEVTRWARTLLEAFDRQAAPEGERDVV